MLQFSLFKQHPDLVHGVFDKNSGNFSPHHGSPNQINDNLKAISRHLEIDQKSFISVDQVHSDEIIVIKSTTQAKQIKADGMITNLLGKTLLLKTADCIPVFMFDPIRKVIALIHAGWRGAYKEIHLQALQLLKKHFAAHPQDILIGIGPAICSQCYQIESEPLQAKLADWQKFIIKSKTGWRVDLPGYLEASLQKHGIKKNHLEIINQCTFENPQKWFSHQFSKSSGDPEGRFASIIGLRQ